MESERAALEKYRLLDVKETGREFGKGSYAAVIEVEYKGLVCAAKKLYPVLYVQGVGDLVPRFEKECKLLSELRHPHIVQFVGIWFESAESRVPVLVMEFLPTTLAQCVERSSPLPDEITYSLLQDVALGLRYLHERREPIIHRDLSANNVLLTGDMRAKISDLGVAKILDLDHRKMSRMTKGPGTPSYMPPEATLDDPCYDIKVDIFSYGVTMVHVFCGQWPEPGRAKIPSTTSEESLIAVPEAGRRQKYLDDIGRDHPLMKLILQCLKDRPRQRPVIAEVFRQVNDVASRFPPTFTDKIEVLERMKFEADEKAEMQRMKDMEIQRVKDEKDAEILRAVSEKEAQYQAESRRAISEKDAKIRRALSKIREKDAEIQRINREQHALVERVISEKEREIQRVISEKDMECQIKLQEKDRQLQTAIEQLQTQVHTSEAVVQCLDEEAEQLRNELQTKEETIAAVQKELDSKSGLLAWLDESLKEARQRIVANHQPNSVQEAQSEESKVGPQQNTDLNISRPSTDCRASEQPPPVIQTSYPVVSERSTTLPDIKMVPTTAASENAHSVIPVMDVATTTGKTVPTATVSRSAPSVSEHRAFAVEQSEAQDQPRQIPATRDAGKTVPSTAASEIAQSVPISQSEICTSDDHAGKTDPVTEVPVSVLASNARKRVFTTAEITTVSSATPVPIMATGKTVTHQPAHGPEEPQIQYGGRAVFESTRLMPIHTTVESKVYVSHQVSATADRYKTEEEEQANIHSDINFITAETEEVTSLDFRGRTGTSNSVSTSSTAASKTSIAFGAGSPPSVPISSEAGEIIPTTAENPIVSSATPVPIIATGDRQPPQHSQLMHSESVGLLHMRPHPMPMPKSKPKLYASHKIPTPAKNPTISSPIPTPGMATAVTQPCGPEEPLWLMQSENLAISSPTPMPTEVSQKRRTYSNAATLPRSWKQRSAFTPIESKGPASSQMAAILKKDPKLERLLQRQNKKADDGIPGEDYQLLEEQRKAKRKNDPPPAEVTSELQEKLRNRRRF